VGVAGWVGGQAQRDPADERRPCLAGSRVHDTGDHQEQKDIAKQHPEVLSRMEGELEVFHASLAKDAGRHPDLLAMKGGGGGDDE
jgi:hypothetical protein